MDKAYQRIALDLNDRWPKRDLVLRKEKCELWSKQRNATTNQQVKRNLGNDFEVLGASIVVSEYTFKFNRVGSHEKSCVDTRFYGKK